MTLTSVSTGSGNTIMELTKQELEELAELHAEVIASKTARADFREFIQHGPGRIDSLEMNMEHIWKPIGE
jgi:hypothetical protein